MKSGHSEAIREDDHLPRLSASLLHSESTFVRFELKVKKVPSGFDRDEQLEKRSRRESLDTLE